MDKYNFLIPQGRWVTLRNVPEIFPVSPRALLLDSTPFPGFLPFPVSTRTSWDPLTDKRLELNPCVRVTVSAGSGPEKQTLRMELWNWITQQPDGNKP